MTNVTFHPQQVVEAFFRWTLSWARTQHHLASPLLPSSFKMSEANADSDTERAIELVAVGNASRTKFESTRSLSDLNLAIDSYYQAVRLFPSPNHPKLVPCLGNLAVSLR